MKKSLQRIVALMLTAVLMVSGVWFIANTADGQASQAATTNTWSGKTPKYIFLFIGDGLSYAQIATATDYLGTLESEGKEVVDVDLSFTKFNVAGTATTYDSTSFCPDSASTATSMSTGYKTHSGVINMDKQKVVSYETISEKLKKQLGYKIGVVSSVPINHATPAAFYAHQASRNNYYEIGLELIDSGFDYFGGGGLLQQTGKDSKSKDLITIATEKGFTVPTTNQEILNLNSQNAPVLAIEPSSAGSAMPYEIDRKNGDLSLADFTRKGIDVLFNNKGFFMMVEGGKIDWACHANDAMSTIQDTLAFDKAVAEAVKFYNKYPNDTLILVTGDHETGGLTIGYAATGYSTYLDILTKQTMSYDMFDKKVADFRTNKTSFEVALKDVKTSFGLMPASDKDSAENPNLTLSAYEYDLLKASYELSMIARADRKLTDADKIAYGGYEPFSVTLTHLLNNKAGIGWTSYSHTGVPVAVFAKGIGSQIFNGYYDNTDIFVKLKALTNVK